MKCHRDETLDSLIGKKVQITFTDGYVTAGVLGYANNFSSEHGYRRPFLYYCGNFSFRKSHVRKIKEYARL